MKAPEQLVDLNAALRAAYQTYRDSHWRVRGSDYYGNHRLLQRLYEETEPLIDKLGERITGRFGDEWLRSTEHLDRVASYANEFHRQDPMLAAYVAAARVHELIDEAYREMKEDDQLTLGTDDLLMSMQSTVETHLYLLQQAENISPLSTKKLKTKLLR